MIHPLFRTALRSSAILAIAGFTASSAQAGPPFLTDDPEPTDKGHWEIYAPVMEVEGQGSEASGSVGAEFNYGAADNLQLTLGLPASFSRDRAGWKWGAGDIEASAKYRLINDTRSKFQLAVFPGLSIPTASHGLGAGRVNALLPVWLQKDSGKWSVFGGGGYAVNPGPGMRDYWTGGIAVSRQIGDHFLMGAEVDRQGADEVDARAQTSLGAGAIYAFKGPLRLLASAGPTFQDGHRSGGYHAYLALGIDY